MKRIIGILLIIGAGVAWPALDQTNVNGKYINLLHVIEAPNDRAEYGEFCDWGYWLGDSWQEYTNLSPGFWVYVYPNWYLWEKLAVQTGLDLKASVNGKYLVLINVLKVPQDATVYGAYYDYGFWEEYSYAGYENLAPGYWVYMAPNWYIWANTKDDPCTGT